ncbi:histone acetyltransferase HAC12 [Trifolium repens]|nr:histone acetyltransferase HAC12 [Trifolium repens]
MPLKDSHLENTWKQMPTSSSSYVSNVPRKRAFDELSNQVGLSANWRDHPEITYNRRWMRKKISRLIGFGTENEKVATKLEWFLFLCADSKEAYMNQETLNQRVHFQLQKAGLSQHSIVPDLPRLPESIATFSDTNVLYNSHVSGRGSYLPQQHKNNLETNNECMNFATTVGKSLQSADSNLMLPQLVSMDTSEHSNLFPRMRSSLELKDTRQYQHQELEFQNSFTHHGNTEAMLQPTKRQKTMEYAFGVSSVNDANIDQSTHEMVQPCSFERLLEAKQQLGFEEYSVEQFTNLVLDSDRVHVAAEDRTPEQLIHHTTGGPRILYVYSRRKGTKGISG